jgi:hypothetical protein
MPQPDEPNPLLMEEIPSTVDELLTKVRQLFRCADGPRAPRIEIPAELERGSRDEPPPAPLVLPYMTLRYATRPLGESNERRLVMALLEPLIDAYRQLTETQGVCEPRLFWRQRPRIYTLKGISLIRCRLAIPGANMSRYATPEGDPTPFV